MFTIDIFFLVIEELANSQKYSQLFFSLATKTLKNNLV